MAGRHEAGRERSRRDALLLGTALGAALGWAAHAQAQPAPGARPQGGTVVAGSAAITRGATDTRVTQGSSRAVIDWSGFDVGRTQSVTFAQPGASAIVLNRVESPNPSQIAGRITANGQVVIQNRAGITFAQGAQVDAHALVATAAGMSAERFMAGSTTFDIPARPGAAVVNRGRITVAETGLAALVAPNVTNAGVIEARLGRVVLGGATTHTLDLYGDGLLAIDIGTDGKVVNTGTIRAPGGRVLLTAAAADGIVSTLVEAGGRISADSAAGRTGSVRIAATGGSIIIDGRLSAAGRVAGSAGGRIEVVATGTTTLRDAARLNADGRIGGGTIAIGGGGADAVAIEAGAAIRASATGTGAGGSVSVTSARRTAMAGRIAARGAPKGGAGGQVEVSGREGFRLTGTIDVSAPAGPAGAILLDPQDLAIVAGGGDGALFQPSGAGDGQAAAGNNGGAATPVAAAIDPGVFANLTGNVVLQAARDLSVLSPVDARAASLTLQAGRNLTVAAPLTLSGGGTVTLQAAVTGFAGVAGYDPGGPLGVLAITAGGAVAAPGGGVRLIGGTGGIAVAGALSGTDLALSTTGGGGIALAGRVAALGTLRLAAGGAVTGAGSISAAVLTGTAAGASLVGANTIAELAGFVTTGDFRLTDQRALLLTGAIIAGTAVAPDPANTAGITLTVPGGDLSLGRPGAPAVLNAGTITLLAAGTIAERTGGTVHAYVSANLLTGPGVGRAVASAAAAELTGLNQLGTLGDFQTRGDLRLTNGGGLTVTGLVSAGGTRGSLPANGATLALSAAGDLVLGRETAGGAKLPGLLNAGTVLLSSPAVITQVSGVIEAGLLAGTRAAAEVQLGGDNRIARLGDFAASGQFALANAGDLAVTGTVAAGGGARLSLQTLGALALAPAARLGAGTVALQAGGTIAEQAGAAIRAYLLTGTAGGGAALEEANAIAQLGTFRAAGRLALNTTADLTVRDAVEVDRGAAPGGLLDLTVGGELRLGLSLSAGLLRADTVTLRVSGAITAPNGAIVAGLLSDGGAGTAASLALPGGNIVATLGDFATRGGFRLNDVRDLTVAGTVAAGGTLRLDSGGGITIGAGGQGRLRAGTVELRTPGAIAEAAGGGIEAGLLTGAAGPADVLLAGDNAVAVLGDFTAGGNFRLDSARDLAVAGTVAAAGTLSLSTPGALAIGQAGAGAGAGGSLRADTVALLAGGAITQGVEGTIVAATLTGPAPGLVRATAASAVLTGANTVDTLGDFHVADSFALASRSGLAVTGTVEAGGASLVPGPGALSLAIQGPIGLRAGALLSAGTIALLTGEAIDATAGRVRAALLLGPGPGLGVAEAASLGLGGDNRIGAIGAFAVRGDMAIRSSGPLAVLGTVSAIGAMALDVAGDVAIGAPGVAAALQAARIQLRVDGLLSEPNGVVAAGTLTTLGSGRGGAVAAGAVLLGGENRIGQLVDFASAGDLILNDTDALDIRGTVGFGGRATIAARGTLGIDGRLAGAGALSLDAGADIRVAGGGTIAAGSIAVAAGGAFVQAEGSGGVVTAGSGRLDITAAGPIAFAGTLRAGAMTLTSTGGDIAGNAGSIAATSLAGSAAGSLALDGGGNTVALLGRLSAGRDLTLRDAAPLTLGNLVSAGGTLSIAAAGLRQAAGRVTAGEAASLTMERSLVQDAGATIETAGTLRITAPDGIGFAGTLAGGRSVSLAAARGVILETGANARLVAAMLNADGRLGVGLDPFAGMPGNAVSAVGTLAGHDGPVALSSAVPLAVLGGVAASGPVTLRGAGDLTLAAGAVATSAASGVALVAGGRLAIGAGAQLGGTSLDATAGTAIEAGGTLRGGRVLLATAAPGGTIRLANGTAIETGAAAGPWPAYATALGGAFISTHNLVLDGIMRVSGLAGTRAPSLRIDLSGTGTFAAAGGLSAPTTTVYVDLGGAARLTGRIDAAGLALRYARGGRGGAELSGTILGTGGEAAARLASITPLQSAAYRINACPIGSASCFVVTTERLTPDNPIGDIDIRPARDTPEEADLPLPNVAARDF